MSSDTSKCFDSDTPLISTLCSDLGACVSTYPLARPWCNFGGGLLHTNQTANLPGRLFSSFRRLSHQYLRKSAPHVSWAGSLCQGAAMAATGTPHVGCNRRQARREKRKLTKAAERDASPAVLAIKTLPVQVMPSTEKTSGTDVLQTAALTRKSCASTLVTHFS